jgi:hypothetical protein
VAGMTDRKLDGSGAVGCRLRRLGGVACGGVLLTLVGGWAAPGFAVVKEKPAAAALETAKPMRIPLAAMGYQTLQQDFLLAGSSMLTVNFVDQDHLLVTFGLRRLMKRVVDDPVDDEDRVIGANLVEVASGKVLAQAEWRVHDRSQYLWPLGHGRFLLRVRDRLTMITPMAGERDAFREHPLLTMDGHIVAILTSPDDDLLTVETTKYAMGSGETNRGFSLDAAPVQISFYRLAAGGPSADGLTVVSAGKIRTQTAVALPMSSAGRLEAVEDGKGRWLFNFDEHSGKVDELAGFETTCYPRPMLVGHGDFVAFGCHGSANSIDLAGFNMKGEEMWQQNFYDSHVAPTFAFAPAAGRFALGRTLVSMDLDPEAALPAAAVTGQEVRVYQTYDGRQLFKIDCSPVERAGQNFALSQDGLRLAVVRETMVHHVATKDFAAYDQTEAAVEVYTLPPLSKEDQAAVKEAAKLAPVDTGARIDLALAKSSGPQQKLAPPEPPNPTAVATARSESLEMEGSAAGAEAAASEQGSTPAGTIEEGDVQPSGPRKRPTLYGPDEAPEKKPQ